MIEQWRELKETITDLRDNDGTCTQQEVCKFLVNLMDVLEKQVQWPKDDYNGIMEYIDERLPEEPCEDAISRQAAIDAMWHSVGSENGELQSFAEAVITDAEEEIKALPSAQPERKKGKWIPDEISAYDMPNGKSRGWIPWLCSECGYCVGKHQTRFCPDCGALMCGKAK